MSIDTSKTMIERPFAGAHRLFQLRYGELETLERLCGAGVGEIMLRLAQHRFRVRDIFEVIRLGLEGAGMAEPEATALVIPYRNAPISDHVGLACEILSAAVSGVPEPGEPMAAGA